MAVRDVNVSVDNCIHDLRGEVFNWVHQLNQKLDISLAEVINAIGSEVRTTSQDLELRTISRQNDTAALCRQQALDTDGTIKTLEGRIDAQQSLAEKTASRCSSVLSTVNATRSSIFDDLMDNLETQKQDLLKEMNESSVATNQRVRQLESKNGRSAQKIEAMEQKTNSIDQIHDSVQHVVDATGNIIEEHAALEGHVGDNVATANRQLDSVRVSLDDLNRRLRISEEKIESGPQLPFSVQDFEGLARRSKSLEEQGLRADSPGGSGDTAPPRDVPMHDDQASRSFSDGGELISIFDPPELIDRAKEFWFRALAYDDLTDHIARRAKNLGTPLRTGLPEIEFSADPELWTKLGQIQTALRADMSPYQSWPLRVAHLFTGEFLGISRRIEDTRPTWIVLVTWIGEKVGVLNLSYNHYRRLFEFSSQVQAGDSARDVLMKLYTIAQDVPPNLMSPAALAQQSKRSYIVTYLGHTTEWSPSTLRKKDIPMTGWNRSSVCQIVVST